MISFPHKTPLSYAAILSVILENGASSSTMTPSSWGISSSMREDMQSGFRSGVTDLEGRRAGRREVSGAFRWMALSGAAVGLSCFWRGWWWWCEVVIWGALRDSRMRERLALVAVGEGSICLYPVWEATASMDLKYCFFYILETRFNKKSRV